MWSPDSSIYFLIESVRSKHLLSGSRRSAPSEAIRRETGFVPVTRQPKWLQAIKKRPRRKSMPSERSASPWGQLAFSIERAQFMQPLLCAYKHAWVHWVQ